MMPRLTAMLAMLALGAGVASAAPAAARPTTFTTGIADPVYLQAQGRNAWLDRTVTSGARFILLWVSWGSVSPQRPPAGSDPSNPANTSYDWGTLDATVRAATAHGLRVVLSITSAPPWAQGPGRPCARGAGHVATQRCCTR